MVARIRTYFSDTDKLNLYAPGHLVLYAYVSGTLNYTKNCSDVLQARLYATFSCFQFKYNSIFLIHTFG